MFKKSLSFILISSLLLSGCDFRPSTKVIQYQEEVKLSDGSFIWVDIKRHYGWSGWAPGGGSGAYMPGIVEISWDTGFESVGRQSVFFDNHIYLIDKYQDEWYVIGYRYPYEGSREGIDAVNCRDVGILFNQGNDCLAVFNKQGQFVKKNLTNVQNIDFFKHNLIATDDDDWNKNIAPFLGDSKKISLSKKLDLKKMTNGYLSFNKPYIFKLEYSYE